MPGTLDVSAIFVDSPEQMDFERGMLVTEGTDVVVNCTVSDPVQPLEFVTMAAYVPAWLVLKT